VIFYSIIKKVNKFKLNKYSLKKNKKLKGYNFSWRC